MFFQTLERVRSIATRHSGKTYSPEGLTRLLRSQFRDPQIKFHTLRSSIVPTGEFDIGAEYRPMEDEDGEPCIHVFLTYSTRQRKMHIDRQDWQSLGFHITDVVTHEYIHQHHVRRRGYRFGRGYKGKKLDEKEYRDTMKNYLGCEDEILAYSFNVASEMVVYNRPLEKTRVYKLYRSYFKSDPYIVLKLKRHALKYIRQLEK